VELLKLGNKMFDNEYEADVEEEKEKNYATHKPTRKMLKSSISSTLSSWSSRSSVLEEENVKIQDLSATEQYFSITQLRRWLKDMEKKVEPVSIRHVEDWSLIARLVRLETMQAHLLDIEVKGKSLRTVLSFYTRKRNGAKLQELSQLEQKWHKLWLSCAEWKCLLEVSISQHGGKNLSLSLSSTSSSDSSFSPILLKLKNPIPNCTFSNSFSTLFPTTLKSQEAIMKEDDSFAGKQEQVRTIVKRSNIQSSVRLERIKVSNCERKSSAILPAKAGSFAGVEEIAAEISECSRTSRARQSCNQQHTTMGQFKAATLEEFKSKHDQVCKFEEAEDTAVEDLAIREHFETLDASHVSDFWDQEAYLSEHNYDETLDLETAKTILNFGDDYRNFIESNSEVQSPRFVELEKRKKNSRIKLETERSKLVKDDSNSEDDCTDVFMVIADLKKDIEKYEDDYKILRSKGFENFEKPRQTECILQKCEGSCKFLSSLHRETASNNNFVARKNGREIRFLQNRWKVLEKLARKDQKLKSVYLTIKQDIESLREEIAEHQKKVKLNGKKGVKDLRKYLRFYKDSNIKLTGLKSRLFEVNLAVHTLLADVSGNNEDEVKYLEVDRMKDDVVELYDIWDECIKFVASKLATAEESVKSVSKIEKDLSELSDFLKKETKLLVDKMKISEKTVDDSGISDESGDMFHNIDILEKEENLRHLKICVLQISKTLSPNSPVILGINAALIESAKQLKNLKSYMQNKKTTPAISVQTKMMENDRTDLFWLRVKKFSRLFIIFLSILLLMLVLITPNCCEFRNNMLLFYPRLSYVNGPPPI